jgi:hypothetical protein
LSATIDYDHDHADDHDDIPRFHEEQTNEETVDEQEAIVNIELTLACLEYLQTTIQTSPPRILTLLLQHQHQQQSTNDIEYISIYQWIQDVTIGEESPIARLLSDLPASHIFFLINILTLAGQVQTLVREGKSDLRLFPDPSGTSSDVRVAIYDLAVASHKVQERIKRLEDQVKLARHSAIRCRDANNKKAALYHIQRKKYLEKDIETSYAHLQNMDQQKLALERPIRHNAFMKP